MKVLIVYDSVSPSKVTAAVAKNIAEALNEKGIEVDSVFVADADKAAVKNYDCLLVGAPTMAFRATGAIMQFLNDLPTAELSGKPAAAFDTQVKSRISGSAAKGIDGKLRSLGFKMAAAPLVAFVDGKMKTNEWHLREGETEKTKQWAQELAQALAK